MTEQPTASPHPTPPAPDRVTSPAAAIVAALLATRRKKKVGS